MIVRKLIPGMAGALGVLAMLGTLSACTPADRPLTALRYVDGRPTLLVVACPDFQLDSLAVYPDGGPAASASTIEWQILRESGAPPDQITLLGPPPTGWAAKQTSLTAFTPGQEYGVSAFDGADSAVPIHFTLADLEALAPGQVLVGKPASKRKAVSESTFRDDAGDSC